MSQQHFVSYFPYMVTAVCVAFGVRFMLQERAGPAYLCFLVGVATIPLLSWGQIANKLIPYLYG